MAALKAPFEGSSLDEVYGKVKQCLPDHIPRGYSEKLQTVVMKLIKRNPKDRITMGILSSLDKLLAQPTMRKAAADVFGDLNYFSDYGFQGKMMKTMRLPRKEVDLIKLVNSAASTTKESRSQMSVMSDSRLHHSESSVNLKRSMSNASRLLKPASKDSKFSLVSVQSLNRMQPKIMNLQKNLRDHRVAEALRARPARTGGGQRRPLGRAGEKGGGEQDQRPPRQPGQAAARPAARQELRRLLAAQGVQEKHQRPRVASRDPAPAW